MKCTRCGAETRIAHAAFCSECGERLGDRGAAECPVAVEVNANTTCFLVGTVGPYRTRVTNLTPAPLARVAVSFCARHVSVTDQPPEVRDLPPGAPEAREFCARLSFKDGADPGTEMAELEIHVEGPDGPTVCRSRDPILIGVLPENETPQSIVKNFNIGHDMRDEGARGAGFYAPISVMAEVDSGRITTGAEFIRRWHLSPPDWRPIRVVVDAAATEAVRREREEERRRAEEEKCRRARVEHERAEAEERRKREEEERRRREEEERRRTAEESRRRAEKEALAAEERRARRRAWAFPAGLAMAGGIVGGIVGFLPPDYGVLWWKYCQSLWIGPLIGGGWGLALGIALAALGAIRARWVLAVMVAAGAAGLGVFVLGAALALFLPEPFIVGEIVGALLGGIAGALAPSGNRIVRAWKALVGATVGALAVAFAAVVFQPFSGWSSWYPGPHTVASFVGWIAGHAAGAGLSRALTLTERRLARTAAPAARQWAMVSAACAAALLVVAGAVARRGVVVLAGHSGTVCSVAFSPDGRLLATGSSDNTARLWSVPSGECVARLSGHSGVVGSVAFSPDGRLLVRGSGDYTARLLSVPSGDCEAMPQGHSSDVTSVAFSPDGRHVATGSDDNTARLLSVPSGECVATLRGHSSDVNSVAFSPDGRLVATGGGWGDNTARLWSVPSGECVATLKGHSSGVKSVAFSPDGRLLATGGIGGIARLWSVPSGERVATFGGHLFSITCVAFSPDGRHLATGSNDDTVRLRPLARKFWARQVKHD